MAIPSFAHAVDKNQNREYIYTECGIEKQIYIINSAIKLVSWEDERYRIVEQYDSEDTLYDRVVYDKKTKTATISYNEKMGYGEFVIGESKKISFDPSQLLGAKGYTRGYKIDTVKVFNPLTSPIIEKKMEVWEETESPRTVTYTIASKLKTVSKFATSVAVGLAVGSVVAGKIVAAFIEAGIALVNDEAINKIFPETVAANKTLYLYYGKDDKTSERSRTYQCGVLYKIKDTESKYLDNTYTEEFIYDRGGKHHIECLMH